MINVYKLMIWGISHGISILLVSLRFFFYPYDLSFSLLLAVLQKLVISTIFAIIIALSVLLPHP